jgi:hypothetical protein
MLKKFAVYFYCPSWEFTDLRIEAGAATNVKMWRCENVKMWLAQRS